MTVTRYHYDPNCPYCKGSGERDSGGTMPSGEPAMTDCVCHYEWTRGCPWCGVQPTVLEYKCTPELGWCVCCDNEDCPMSEIAICGHSSEEEAKAAWNSEVWKPEAERTPHDCPWCSKPCMAYDYYDPRFGWEWAALCETNSCVSRNFKGGVHLTSGHRYKTQQEALDVFATRYKEPSGEK